MASSKKQVLVVVVVAAVATILAAPSPALAADILVGDSLQGWRLHMDYINWVDGRDFIVGDTLVFKYVKRRHSVVRAATAASFAACSQANSLGVWTTGDEWVALNTSGDWWFFCRVNDHCQQGMRFTIRVLPAVHISLPPSSTPTGGDTTGLASAQRGGFAAGVLAAVAGVAVLLF